MSKQSTALHPPKSASTNFYLRRICFHLITSLALPIAILLCPKCQKLLLVLILCNIQTRCSPEYQMDAISSLQSAILYLFKRNRKKTITDSSPQSETRRAENVKTCFKQWFQPMIKLNFCLMYRLNKCTKLSISSYPLVEAFAVKPSLFIVLHLKFERLKIPRTALNKDFLFIHSHLLL